jgi:hypothetical protein
MLTATEHHLKIRFVQLYQLVEACKGFAWRVNKRKIKARYPGFLPSFDFSCVSNLEELFYFVEETRQDEVFTGEPAFWQPAIPHQYVGMPLYYGGCNEADFQPGKPYTDYPVLFDEVRFSPFDSLAVARHFAHLHVVDSTRGTAYRENAPAQFGNGTLHYSFIAPALLEEYEYDDSNGERIRYLRLVDNALIEDELRSSKELFEAMKTAPDVDEFAPLIRRLVCDYDDVLLFVEAFGPSVFPHFNETLRSDQALLKLLVYVYGEDFFPLGRE